MATPNNADLAPLLKGLEAGRQAGLHKATWTGLGVAAITIVLALWAYAMSNGMVAVVIGVVGLVIGAMLVRRQLQRIRADFKQQVIPVLLRSIDTSLRFDIDGCIPQADFERSGLFATSPDRYSGSDLITGRIGDTAVRFSFVHAQEEHETTKTDSDGHSRTETEYRTIFSGLLFIADFNKHFAGRTLVMPGAANFLNKLFGSHVALEDPRFNQLFRVTATDQVEARYILTPSMMERLCGLQAKQGNFRAAFFAEHMFLAIDMSPSALTPSVRQPLDSVQVQRIQDRLHSITAIVGDLGLNVRIWTKAAGATGVR